MVVDPAGNGEQEKVRWIGGDGHEPGLYPLVSSILGLTSRLRTERGSLFRSSTGLRLLRLLPVNQSATIRLSGTSERSPDHFELEFLKGVEELDPESGFLFRLLAEKADIAKIGSASAAGAVSIGHQRKSDYPSWFLAEDPEIVFYHVPLL